MTLSEILKGQGMTDEQIDKVISEMKQNKIFTTALENADIRYNDLKGKHEALAREHQESTQLIEKLRKASSGNEALQSKITEYETQIAGLQAENDKIKVDSALRTALLEARAADIDYITFKIKELGEVKLDDNGRVKGIEDTLASLKIQYPQHFPSENRKQIDENKLNNGDDKNKGMTREEFLRKPYAERQQFFNEHPDRFAEIMKS